MNTTSKWIKNYQSVVDNGRNHAMVLDMPPAKNGDDMGPTALELAVMSLNGCINTIFSVVANKMRISFEQLEVELDAQQPEGASTVTEVNFEVKVRSEESEEKLNKCLDATMNTCPVGVLFRDSGVKINRKLTKL